MPVILCPQCRGKLRLPENIEARRVKCPSCGNTFLSSDAEVEGEAPTPKKPTGTTSTTQSKINSALHQARKEKPKEEVEDDFEVIEDEIPRSRKKRDDNEENERPRSRRKDRDEDDEEDRRDRKNSRRRDEDDEDDDRPRSRRREREDDDEDRPRSRRREREEDDEDRPRSRRSRDDDEEDRNRKSSRNRDRIRDDYDDRKKGPSDWSWVKLGLLFNAIGSWCMGGALGLMCLGLILAWAGIGGAFIPKMSGILAIGYLVVSGLGYGFCIPGPNKNGSLGLCIASLSIAGIHLLIAIIIISDGGSGGRSGRFSGDITGLGGVSTAIPMLGTVIYGLFRAGEFLALPFLMAGIEISKLIVFALFLKATSITSKDREGQSLSGGFVIFWSSITGGIVALGIIVILIVEVSGSLRLFSTLFAIQLIGSYGALCGMYVWLGFICQNVNEGLGSGKRRRR